MNRYSQSKRNNTRSVELNKYSRLALALFITLATLGLIVFLSLLQSRINGEVIELRNIKISKALTSSQSVSLLLQEKPTSLKLSAKVVGEGTARVYAVYGGQRYLVVDTENFYVKEITSSAINNIENSTAIEIEKICIDSCFINSTVNETINETNLIFSFSSFKSYSSLS